MQIVIDIDEDYYEIIKHEVSHGHDFKPYTLIANGTPLPKGHGRLIDEDRLYKVFNRNVSGADAFKQLFDDAPTIIEADKEREE